MSGPFLWVEVAGGVVSLSSLASLASIFVGYPAWVWLRARTAPRPYPSGPEATEQTPDEDLPKVAVLMAAHNEAHRLPGKLASLQGLDYPADRLRFFIADDASTDDTPAVLREAEANEPRLTSIRSEVNVGKPTNLNRLVSCVDEAGGADVLMFCDARQPLDPKALRALVAPLVQPEIGGATGDLVFPPAPDGALRGMGAYWRYETLIRTSEAATGSVVGATGALYAVRRSLFVPFEADLVLDDMLLPLRVALGGSRFVFAHGAYAYDTYSADLGHEFKRKARTLGGIYQAMALEPRLLKPGSGVFVPFLFHKVGRLAFPWLMGSMLLGSAAAALSSGVLGWLWWGLLGAQALFYMGGLGAVLLGRAQIGAGPLKVLRTLIALMAASWLGWWQWRQGRSTAAWKPGEARRS